MFSIPPLFYRPRIVWMAGLVCLLLQKTPVLRVLVQAEFAAGVRTGQLLGAIVPVAAAAAAGTVHAQTGATTWQTNPASPVDGTVGQPLTVVFAWSGGRATPVSYEVVGSLPPGLSLRDGVVVNDRLVVNSSQGGAIEGTPTSAGMFSVSLIAWDGLNGTEGTQGSSPSFTLQFNIVEAVNAAPTFTQQPASLTVNFGDNAIFTVGVEGTPTPTLQWRKDQTVLPGETGASLVLDNVTLDDAGTYDVVATNSEGSATSAGATLTVVPPPAPVIDVAPTAITVKEGRAAFFAVRAFGEAIEYQWFHDGTPLVGATGPTLLISGTTSGDSGDYTVRVSNPGGSVESEAAMLTIKADGDARLVNLSTRAVVGTGDNILIPGFAIGGNGRKELLIRAVGPLLADFGVAAETLLPDPRMALFLGGAEVANNDNWEDAPNLPELMGATSDVGAFALKESGKDAAMLVSLDTSPYSVQVRDVGTGTGVALVELYDHDPAGSTSRLVNISARTQVGTGGDKLIPGFVIDGDIALTLLVRGIGPTLGANPFNLAGTLEDPVMTLFRQREDESEVVAVNDDWQTNPELATLTDVTARVGGFELLDGGRDAALLVALPPGAYTVQLEGKNGGTGLGMVEVYVVP
ncbi:MAG: hypothetical protein D6781_04780 [Verrucomicrobia bacterium]|nr:MAG: hypothetical protein D6781_04780 [Verrucomicrobiota bacterium]